VKNYIDLVAKIIQQGEDRNDRTGVGARSIFGHQLEFDLRDRFPLVTAKETRWKTAFLEMLWFLRGEGSTKWLHEHNCKLWDSWADKNGLLGPIYGVQWRSWAGLEIDGYPIFIDQVKVIIESLRKTPASRRHIVSAWNVGNLLDMALPPCHWAHQCYVSNDGHLDMKLFLRSSDVALGLPFNIAQYALLTHLYARAAALKPRRLLVDIGDAHLYSNHIEAMCKVVADGPVWGDSSRLAINTDNTDIDGYSIDDFDVVGYHPGPFVKLEVAV
jgi:thymidylate synthase